MTLMQIITSALREMGYEPDAQNIETFRRKFTLFANEGLNELSRAMELRRTDTLTITDGEISIEELPYNCVKIIEVAQNGTSLDFYRGSSTTHIKVSTTGDVQVEYRYVARPLSSDTDVPGIPESLHNLLVIYICAREYSTANVDTQDRSKIYYSMYMKGKAAAQQDYGEVETYTIKNKGW